MTALYFTILSEERAGEISQYRGGAMEVSVESCRNQEAGQGGKSNKKGHILTEHFGAKGGEEQVAILSKGGENKKKGAVLARKKREKRRSTPAVIPREPGANKPFAGEEEANPRAKLVRFPKLSITRKKEETWGG